MSKFIAVTGNHPKISVSEIEQIYGSDIIHQVSERFIVLNDPIDLKRLGSIVKLTRVVQLQDSSPEQIADFIKNSVKPLAKSLNFGFSDYTGQNANINHHLIKSSLRPSLNIRYIQPKNQRNLSSAEIFNNKLDLANKGLELNKITVQSKIYYTVTTAVQNLRSYSLRDQNRPFRDAKVGMLPPKLAQIIVNLTGGDTSRHLLDPFCGSGVILQEALLMGYPVTGSDLSHKMVEYSQGNMSWLSDTFKKRQFNYQITKQDATQAQWPNIQTVACETYLGKPFPSLPSKQVLDEEINSNNQLISTFLKNLAPQLPKNANICLAVACWRIKDQQYHLKLVDNLEHLGYTYNVLKYSDPKDLVYRRPNQIVGRQLLALRRI